MVLIVARIRPRGREGGGKPVLTKPQDSWNQRRSTHSLAGALGWSVLFGAIYLVARRYPKGAVGQYALWALIVLLFVIYLGNALGGQVPPSETAIAVLGLGTWLFVPWAYWIDRHREPALR
jgi:hypothetical protein